MVQPGRLPLRNLKFGSVDARYEVLTRDKNTLEHFKESFVTPTGMPLEEYMSGRRFFIHGMKGAGKTAFLRYIELSAQEKGFLTRFTSFADEISDSERERIIKDSGIQIYEQKGLEAPAECVNMWVLFILNQLSQLIEENRHLFTSSRNLKLFCELMVKLHDGAEKSILTWLQGLFKKGKYKLKTKYVEFSAKGTTEDIEREYTIDQIVKHALSLLNDLSWEGKPGIYLFFDELNLSFASRNQHKRDTILIRDLIIAIDRVNSFFIKAQKPVYLLASARTEVLNVVTTPTHEINKILLDRGRDLQWFPLTAGGDWPIVNLFVKKVRASETIANYKPTADVFREYFQSGLFGMSPPSFIVEMTWCNPRDLILLFGDAASKAVGGEQKFDEVVIKKVLQRYSQEAWREKTEELSVEYAAVEIAALKKILLNSRQIFRLQHFDMEAKNKGRSDQNVDQFYKKRHVSKVLEDLYRVGVIGQASKPPQESGRAYAQFSEHWAYRGDVNFDPTGWMVIHRALWSDLRLGDVKLNPGLDLHKNSIPRSDYRPPSQGRRPTR